jgi:CPA2 family monovalent cation:H+ antiporter-2
MDLYFQIAICFAAIGISALIAEKTKLFFAPFYILAGVLLGPNVLNLVSDSEVISLFGEIGVVFLLFFLGLEFSIHTLLKQKRPLLIAGAIDFAVNFSLGFALGLLLGLNVTYCLLVAGAIYMSSSGIITKSLIELQINKNREGHLIMGIMVFEDLAMVLLLVLVTTGLQADGADIGSTLLQLGVSLAFCALLVVAAKKASWLLEKIVSIRKKELLLLVFFGVVLLVTSLGKLLGVSEALAAFFLGAAFSGVKNVKNIEHTAVTFRDLFGSVFFFSFGMALRPSDLGAYWNIIAYCLVVAVVGKLLSSFIITRILKCEKNMGLFIGFLTIPRGEFSLLLAKLSVAGIPFIGPVMVVLAFLTTAISSLVLKLSKLLCKTYNICIAFPRSRIQEDRPEWGEID